MIEDDRYSDDRSRRDRVAWALALAFVVSTLAALVVIPVVVQQRVDALRAETEASEPARTLVMRLQFNLVREIAALNQFALTRDTASARTFTVARTDERAIWAGLHEISERLGTTVHEDFVEARTIAEIWHQRLNEEELLRQAGGLTTLQTLEVRERFEAVLGAAAKFDLAVLRATAVNRERINRAERWGIRLTFISGALALLTAAVVGALVLRIRNLAVEAERRRREAARALTESAVAAEGRQRLLRGITHDVKNPLGAARGYAELLAMGLKGPLNPEQGKLVEGVDRSIDSALAIISDLLDLARADSGGIPLNRVETDLNEIARQAAEDHRAAAEAAGHSIDVTTTSAALSVYTDPARVRQVLDNLISNAIKYTEPPGKILVRPDARATDAPFGRRATAIRVIDNGRGIPDEERDRIFDEFTRVSDHGDVKGHGLGLAIARRMARLLGGELGLAPKQNGTGSEFVLWLPLREQRTQPRHERVQPTAAAD